MIHLKLVIHNGPFAQQLMILEFKTTESTS